MQAYDGNERQVGWVKNWQKLWDEKVLFRCRWGGGEETKYITLPTINWNIPAVVLSTRNKHSKWKTVFADSLFFRENLEKSPENKTFTSFST